MTGSHLNGVAVGTGVLSAATGECPPEMGPIKPLSVYAYGQDISPTDLFFCNVSGLWREARPQPEPSPDQSHNGFIPLPQLSWDNGLATVYKAAPDSPVV